MDVINQIESCRLWDDYYKNQLKNEITEHHAAVAGGRKSTALMRFVKERAQNDYQFANMIGISNPFSDETWSEWQLDEKRAASLSDLTSSKIQQNNNKLH